MDAFTHLAPQINRTTLQGLELSLNGCTKLADVSVTFRREAADLHDEPPQGDSIEILKAFLCNAKGQPALDITSLLDESWTEELTAQLKEGACESF